MIKITAWPSSLGSY